MQKVTTNPRDQFISTLFVVQQKNNTSSLQLEATECLCAVNQIQNGRSGVTSLYPMGERLHDEIGPKGRLLFNSNNENAQKVSALHIRQCNIRIPMPTVRTLVTAPRTFTKVLKPMVALLGNEDCV